ncbi:dihydrodipicolinate reductase [Shimia ponticola]|uniref:dihydrodipicolinate reductase n=1 Tax=Shimia ponticola TaxID=2582893 RepID=UPI0011BEC283|nr:dihydrodipicolinate reductase [Shimia ponticola]
MLRTATLTAVAMLFTLGATAADAMEKLSERDQFLQTLDGRNLTIGIYGLSLAVLPDGQIAGRAAGRDVVGEWSWQDGYFCRSMMWGQREIPYNCQLVQYDGREMRFTTDRGEGDYADFRLR